MRTAIFDYHLPADQIAQRPAPERDQSRLLVLRRDPRKMEHGQVSDLPDHLQPGDVLVLNDSKVIRARLHGENPQTGTRFEILLLRENATNDFWAMMRPGKRARPNTRLLLQSPGGRACEVEAIISEKNSEGHRRLHFSGTRNILEALEELGEVPLPPYISRAQAADLREDEARYQTVYARHAGSIAAPTAGLHFTERLLERTRQMGVQVCFTTLHVGLGTFAPVKAESLGEHVMHTGRFTVSESAARVINAAKRAKQRVIAVGTTTVRVLETVAARNNSLIAPGSGQTNLFIHPPFRFQVVDGLLTNFHLPRSTLLMLVCAFAAPGETGGRDFVLEAYAEAVRQRYRFYSYGDAMLIL